MVEPADSGIYCTVGMFCGLFDFCFGLAKTVLHGNIDLTLVNSKTVKLPRSLSVSLSICEDELDTDETLYSCSIKYTYFKGDN